MCTAVRSVGYSEEMDDTVCLLRHRRLVKMTLQVNIGMCYKVSIYESSMLTCGSDLSKRSQPHLHIDVLDYARALSLGRGRGRENASGGG